MDDQMDQAALDYHRFPSAGKIALQITKPMATQRDLALAYSPGVAAACLAIARDPASAATLTSRSNLVAVVTNGSAVLGLGNIGPLASKPVMEGKGCLFKKFADIDVFDIEIDESDSNKLVEVIAALKPTFGGINLEDIQAPHCFYIERKLRERMKIPVFHDDQHGTAIIVGAAVLNWLHIVDRKIENIKIVCSGCGAAAVACLDLLLQLGLNGSNIWVSDINGVLYKGRNIPMSPEQWRYARQTSARSLGDIIEDADVFLGVSAAGVLSAEMLQRMASRPLVLALANPEPEIRPEAAITARPDAIIATGRSDYPNQVNNVLCFPFIFRGALDAGATVINDRMKIAALHAIADLARSEQSDIAAIAYGKDAPSFGPEYLIPRPFDPRLLTTVAPAVARAAMESGVSGTPITDFKDYRRRLENLIYRSGNIMTPVFLAASRSGQRIVYADGEDSRVLRAAHIVSDEKLAYPVLVGNQRTIKQRIDQLGLRLQPGNCEFIDLGEAPVVNNSARQSLADYNPSAQSEPLRTAIAAKLVDTGGYDALLCGIGGGSFSDHLAAIHRSIGAKSESGLLAAMHLILLPKHSLFVCDTHVNIDPGAEDLAEIANLAAEEVSRFGLNPKVGLVSPPQHARTPAACKMERVLTLARKQKPSLEIVGPIHADIALKSAIEAKINILILPTLDTASIAFNMLRILSGDVVTVGPILLGTARPAHILTSAHTVRGIINMTALAAVQANSSSAAQVF